MHVSNHLPSTPALTAPSTDSTDCLPEFNEILSSARTRVEWCRNHTPGMTELDRTRLVIEDQDGFLMYAEGNLSFMMPAAPPQTDLGFTEQLNPDVQEEYDEHQANAWTEENRRGVLFPVSAAWNAVVLPLMLNEVLLTVTAFSPCQ